jgi:general secretion pathway protein G
MKFKRNRGFSLLELLIIILIIALLVAVAIPQFADFKLRSQRTKAKQDIDVIVSAVALFEQEEGLTLWSYAKIQDTAGTFTASERTIPTLLVGPYLKKLPADPWGNAYILDAECGYVLSKGKNGVELQTDVLADQDIKVFYNASGLTIRNAEYVDVQNDGLVAGDKLYVYLTQVVDFASDATDFAGTIAGTDYYDTYSLAGVITDDDNAIPTADADPTATVAHATWVAFRTAAGAVVNTPTIATWTACAGYKDDGVDCDYNTNVLIFTLSGDATSSQIATACKAGGFINLGATAVAVGADGLTPCDLTVATAAVYSAGWGISVKVNK